MGMTSIIKSSYALSESLLHIFYSQIHLSLCEHSTKLEQLNGSNDISFILYSFTFLTLCQIATAILEVPAHVSRVHASRRTFQLLADRSCMLPVIHSVAFKTLKDKVVNIFIVILFFLRFVFHCQSVQHLVCQLSSFISIFFIVALFLLPLSPVSMLFLSHNVFNLLRFKLLLSTLVGRFQ